MARANITAQEVSRRIQSLDRITQFAKSKNSIELAALVNEFIRYMTETIRVEIPSFNSKNNDGAWEVSYGQTDTNGGYSVGVSIVDSYLKRQSFRISSKGDERTGEGVYDIVGLFVQGYELRGRRVYGYWDGHGDSVFGARRKRVGNPFIERAVMYFENLHKDLGINISINNEAW